MARRLEHRLSAGNIGDACDKTVHEALMKQLQFHPCTITPQFCIRNCHIEEKT